MRESAEFAAPVAAEKAGIPHVRVAVNNGVAQRERIQYAASALDVLRESVGLAPDNGAALRGEPVFTAFPAALGGPTADAGWRHHFACVGKARRWHHELCLPHGHQKPARLSFN